LANLSNRIFNLSGEREVLAKDKTEK
jgi:hypothetical protein